MADSLFTGTPASVAENDGSAVNTGTTFRVASNVSCTHHRFYAPSSGAGTVTARLYRYTDEENDPVLLAEKVYSSITPGAYNSVAWDTPVALVTGEYYLTQHHASGGGYVATGSAFGSDVTSAGGLLVAIATGSSTGVGVLRNGKYRYLALAFADQNGNSINFFDDVIVSAGLSAAIGTATETDAALALARAKARLVGTAAETDTAPALGRAKALAVGPAVTSDVALPITAAKARTLGIAVETATALTLGRAKQRAIGTATTAETALPISGGQPLVVARAVATSAVTARRAATSAVSARRTTTSTVSGG